MLQPTNHAPPPLVFQDPKDVLTPITEFYSALPKQLQYHQSTAPYRAHIGGYGSGKTLNGLMEAVLTCLMVPGCNCLILRTTSPDIQKTVINLFLKTVPRNLYIQYNKNEKIAYFENGSQLHFGYCQRDEDVNQYLSTEYIYIHLEEAGEFSFRIFEALIGRARTSALVKDLEGNVVEPSIGLTTNPFGNGWGWIKRLFYEHQPIKGMKVYDPKDYFMVHSTVHDNPFVYTAAYIKKLETMTTERRNQALYGDMDSLIGQMYPQFNVGQHENIHVMSPSEIRFKSWEPIWCGSDWGLAHHWPVIWFTKGQIVDRINGGFRTVTVAFREKIFHEMNAIQVADEIARACDHECEGGEKHLRGTCTVKRVKEHVKQFFFSWDRFMRHENNHTIAQQLGERMSKYGLPRPTSADKNRIDGWALIGQLLDMDDLVITTECRELINALPVLLRDSPNDPEDVRKMDTIEDDIADAFRYGIKSYLNPGKKPRAVSESEMLDAIKDPLAARIKAYELYNKNKERKPVYQDNRVLPWQRRRR